MPTDLIIALVLLSMCAAGLYLIASVNHGE